MIIQGVKSLAISAKQIKDYETIVSQLDLPYIFRTQHFPVLPPSYSKYVSLMLQEAPEVIKV